MLYLDRNSGWMWAGVYGLGLRLRLRDNLL